MKATRGRMGLHASRGAWPRLLAQPRFASLLLTAALGLAAPSMWVGWQADDYLLRARLLEARGKSLPATLEAVNALFVFMDGNPAHTLAQIERGTFPWYSLPDGQVAFWRPFAAVTHWLDFQLWPGWPGLMHLHSLVWYGALVVVSLKAYRRLTRAAPEGLRASGGGAWAPVSLASLAALLYGLDDARGFAVGWLSNRNVLIAATFGLLSLMAHDRWRREGWRWGAFAAPAAFAVALLSGESAVATLAYLGAYSLILDRSGSVRRAACLIPYGLTLGLWQAAYARLGFGAWGTAYIQPLAEPVRFLRAVAERGPILLLGQWALPPAELYAFLTPPVSAWLWGMALLVMGGLALCFAPRLRRSALARFYALGMLLAAIPASAALPANRLLFFVGFGAFGVLTAALMTDGRSGILRVLAFFHLLQIPFVPLTAFSPVLMGTFEPAPSGLPTEAAFAEQSAIFVNAPSHFHVGYLPTIRALTGQPIPARIRVLAPGLVSVTYTRADAVTLVVRPAGGYLTGFETVYRSEAYPLALGQSISLSDMRIKVLELTGDGRPALVAFQFAVPLESASLRWLQWSGYRYTPFTPPAIGHTVVLAAAWPVMPETPPLAPPLPAFLIN